MEMTQADIRKALRKTKRFSRKLEADTGIKCTDKPTQNLVLCNAGQATRLDKDTLFELMQKTCPEIDLPKYVPQKGQSYSFLVFKNVSTAELFYELCHGQLKVIVNGPPIYLNFVDSVPDPTVVCYDAEPSGLKVIENFINDEEEKVLLNIFDMAENADATSAQLKNRQVMHFGYAFRYGYNDVDLSAPLDSKIPEECNFILERLRGHGVNISVMPDQLTVNKYSPGHGIPSHVDKHSPFGRCILSLSLGSSIVMDWKHHSGKNVPVVIPNKSLLVMEGEARYDWQHGIQAKVSDPRIEMRQIPSDNGITREAKIITEDEQPRGSRISLTFRWTRSGCCECDYPTLCDSGTGNFTLIDNNVAEHLEDLHVHQVYEKIASHFSTTRHKRWPRVEEFVKSIAPGSVMLDLGSGNGKNILKRNDVLQIAAERSSGLLLECKEYIGDIPAADCLRADMLSTPFVEGCADVVICIAVIHHFSNQDRRTKAISEIAKLLRVGGTALITVWARNQAKANYLSKNKDTEDQSVSRKTVANVNLPIHVNRTQFQHTDVFVPWKLRNVNSETENVREPEEVLLRFYHVFDEGELENLCKSVSSLEVIESYYEQGNWCVVCKKNNLELSK